MKKFAHYQVLGEEGWNTWVAQSVKHTALGFGSGHALTGHEIELYVRLGVDSAEPE